MRRIGILTYYHKSKNFGGLLQAYALTNFLNKFGFGAKQIPFDITIVSKRSKLQKLKLTLKRQSLKKFYLHIKQYYYNLIYKKNTLFIKEEMKLFEDFENFILHDEQVYNENNIVEANKKYDIFVIGSDQVFASYNLSSSAFYADFVAEDKKVISYSGSSDIKIFPKEAEQIFATKLRNFDAISVREETLKDYIESITNKKVTVVLDPTFLLSKEEWMKIANQKNLSNKKYILCYFLGSFSSWQRKKAQAYADKYGYEVIHLPYIMSTIHPADKYLKSDGRHDVGPREFISLINNAECIFTDSFHGMVFSINFNKKFYVFNKDDLSDSLSMNSRITDMLDLLKLSFRLITNKKAIIDNLPIDYSKANEILKEEKEKSINWLLNVLKD